jgi:hypothetical protein
LVRQILIDVSVGRVLSPSTLFINVLIQIKRVYTKVIINGGGLY